MNPHPPGHPHPPEQAQPPPHPTECEGCVRAPAAQRKEVLRKRLVQLGRAQAQAEAEERSAIAVRRERRRSRRHATRLRPFPTYNTPPTRPSPTSL